MANINLLPWREEERRERQRQFVSILGLVAVLAVLVMWLVSSYYSKQVENQDSRNRYLQGEIKKLESKIKEIETLEKERRELKDRMELIQNLQKSRPQIVHLFDEIVVQIPEGVNLQAIERKGETVTFFGVSESGPRISKFMRNLDKSGWLVDADLKGIEEDADSGAGRKKFTMVAKLANPEKTEAEAE